MGPISSTGSHPSPLCTCHRWGGVLSDGAVCCSPDELTHPLKPRLTPGASFFLVHIPATRQMGPAPPATGSPHLPSALGTSGRVRLEAPAYVPGLSLCLSPVENLHLGPALFLNGSANERIMERIPQTRGRAGGCDSPPRQPPAPHDVPPWPHQPAGPFFTSRDADGVAPRVPP